MKKRVGIFKYLLVLIVAIAVVFVVRIFANKEEVSYTIPRPAVTIARPIVGTMEESLTLNGHLEARSMIPIIPLVSGTILDYPVRAGDVVEEGQVLAQIDPEPFRQQMLQAQAAYTGYEGSFKRVEGLYRAGAATRQEYDTLKSQRDAAKAQYDLAVLQLGYASVSSPVAGRVLAAPLSEGTVAAAPQPVAVVADLEDLVVRLKVPEKYFSLFTKNRNTLRAQIILPNSQVVVPAQVDTMAPYVDATSKTFETVFKLDESPENLSPGIFVRVKIIFNSHENVLLLPITATKTDGSLYKFNQETDENSRSGEAVLGVAQSINLENPLSDNNWVMVPDQYQNQAFIIEGQDRVLPNQPVSGRWKSIQQEIEITSQKNPQVQSEKVPSIGENQGEEQD